MTHPLRFDRGIRILAIVGLVTHVASMIDLSAQARGTLRGGGGTSTSRVVSPVVVASWMSHENYADGRATSLLVLWRGTPGWFSKGSRGGGFSAGGGTGPNGSSGFQYVSEGGLAFRLDFDYDKRIVRILDQQISLEATNVVLVDFVDGANGPAIVGVRWIDPAPAGQVSAVDPIAAIVRRTPELFEYLRCDFSVSDPVMNAMMPIVCGQMRP